jgi:hypothetical protein
MRLALILALIAGPVLALGEDPEGALPAADRVFGLDADGVAMARPAAIAAATDQGEAGPPGPMPGLRPLARPVAAAVAPPLRPVARPMSDEVASPFPAEVAAALSSPLPRLRPVARPLVLEAGEGDAVIALPRPGLRPLARPGADFAPAGGAPIRPRARTAADPAVVPVLSTRGIALPAPRLARTELHLGEVPADLMHDTLLVLPGAPGLTEVAPQVMPALLIAPIGAGPSRPMARPLALQEAALIIALPRAPGRPVQRPAGLALDRAARAAEAARIGIVAIVTRQAVAQSLIPPIRPERVAYRPADDSPPEAAEDSVSPIPVSNEPLVQGGALCGDSRLRGEAVGSVPGPGACGIEGAVRVTSVRGIRLSEGALMDCTTARTLADWVDGGAVPAVGDLGGGIARLDVMGHYACRGRNNQSGARLSEHSFGRAIDIGGITLQDGTRITVLNGWGSDAYGRILRAMHRAACGPFGTVLGPNANRFHRDHFHFDTARYRSGSYCE